MSVFFSFLYNLMLQECYVLYRNCNLDPHLYHYSFFCRISAAATAPSNILSESLFVYLCK